MPMSYSPTFGLLPEPEGRTASFVTSSAINLSILAVILMIGMTARRVIQQHYEMTELIVPRQAPPPMKVKPQVLPKLPPPPQTPKLEMEAPKIRVQQPKPPEPKAVEMQAKLALPAIKEAKPAIVLAPQPKAALAAAMPAQSPTVKASTAPVHLGQTFGVRPNPNAVRPATVAAIGNPYGGMEGPAVAPHGVVGSTGIGNSTHFGSNAGVVGRVASAGIPGETGRGGGAVYGHVASAGIPATVTPAAVVRQRAEQPTSTALEVISKPEVRYTAEARQLRVQGDVVLRVTFLASGQVVVQGVVHGLGHGLDEEARRVAEQIRFRPATRNGRPVDLTTNITITFQLA
jgi:TonB family protein